MGYATMRVYSAAERLRVLVDELRPHLKRGFANMFRHVDDAVDSALLNIAEGSDCKFPGRQIEFFDIARNSANEAGSGLRMLGKQRAFGDQSVLPAVGVAFTMTKMLSTLMQTVAARDPVAPTLRDPPLDPAPPPNQPQ